MPDLPEGLITFVLTDVEGSTRLWEDAPDSMMEALRHHDDDIEGAAEAHRGVVVRPRGEGDSRFLVFADPSDAVAGAAELQRRLAEREWPTPRPIRVRASVHTGVADLHLGDYYGSVVNRAARLRGIAHGGQTVISQATRDRLSDDGIPDGVSLLDMGEHRLKDLTAPERVYQLDVAGLQDRFPPLQSLNEVANNLPIQLTEFVGRESELAMVAALLAKTRLLTILASGGSGKTRLAIQVAADRIADYPDGVFFVGFAGIDSDDNMVQAIAEALGIALTGEEDAETQLLAHLATRRQLLVFDNMEHLDAAPLVSDILKGAPYLTVIATSRSKMNLAGETVLPLSGLETVWEVPEDAWKTSGVRLFVEAARRANPAFSIDEGDLEALAEILRLTGGLPLAILLSAAWVDMLAIEQIVAEIAENLDFLETDMADLPERQRSIRAVFDHSWELLGADDQQIFTALSVFRGSFTRDAAEAVAGASLRALAGLVSKSLIVASPDEGRYAIHELLRQYAEAKLEADPARCEAILDRHAAYYARMTGEARTLITSGGQGKLLTIVEADIENVRSAWWRLADTGDPATMRQFFLALFLVYETRGWYRSAVTFFDETVDRVSADESDEDVVVVRALASAIKAWHLALLSRPDEGKAIAAESVRLLQQTSDPIVHWIAVQCLAICLAYLGEADEMRARLDAAVERLESFEDPFWVSSMNDWRSFSAMLAGDLEQAARLAEAAKEGVTPHGEYWVTVWNLWLRALFATEEKRYQDAIDLYADQVAACREISYVRGTVVSNEGLGEANVAAGRLEDAERAFVEGVRSADRMGMVPDVLSMAAKTGTVWARQGRHAEAVELLATVVAEPMSSHLPFAGSDPIRDIALSSLTEIEASMDPAQYQEAFERGRARPYDVLVKELLAAG